MYRHFGKFLTTALLGAVYSAAAAFGGTVNFDEFTSPPVTCCFADTGVTGPLIYPNVTIQDGAGGGSVMNSGGWSGMQTSGDNLFGTLTSTISLAFNSPVSNLAFDVINGSDGAPFAVDLYGPGSSLLASYVLSLTGFTETGSVWNFSSNIAGVTNAVVTQNTTGFVDFAIDTVSWTGSDVPEPGTFGLLGAAIVGLGLLRRRSA